MVCVEGSLRLKEEAIASLHLETIWIDIQFPQFRR